MRLRTLAAASLLLALGGAESASAATADATVTGGTLSFINSSPSNVTFPGVTLNGSDRTTSQTQTLDISDARGTGVGWNVTATSTLFTSGGNTIPAGKVTVGSAPGVACDASVTCTVSAPTGMSYPYTLPSAAVAPAATKMYNAAAATGLGAQTVTPTWTLNVPADTRAGTYTSTWTFSLVSGP